MLKKEKSVKFDFHWQVFSSFFLNVLKNEECFYNNTLTLVIFTDYVQQGCIILRIAMIRQ